MVQNTIKRIKFKRNPAGITHIDVDFGSWTIANTCVSLLNIRHRAFRLTRRGQRIEYRNGDHYVELNVDIERIS